MESPHKQEDKLNNVVIVTVGVCGSILVYVSIALLQAFYFNDSHGLIDEATYGGQDVFYKTVRAQQEQIIGSYSRSVGNNGAPDSYRIAIDQAMKLVAAEAQVDASNLVPVVGRSAQPTIKPAYGRPQPLEALAPAADAAATAPAAATQPAAAGLPGEPAATPAPAPTPAAPTPGRAAAPAPAAAPSAPATRPATAPAPANRAPATRPAAAPAPVPAAPARGGNVTQPR